jgi:ribosomal protein S18 acetylase RimI-like enzyme
MEIKEYDAKYQAQLEHIYLTARQDTFQWMDTSHYKLSDFIEDTKGEKIWLADDSSGVLGFIAVWSQDQFIHHLYVNKRAQRKGVGKALIDTVSQFYQQAIRLKCLCNNQNAIQFYQSQGFKELSKGVDKEGDYLFLQRG